MRFMAFVFGSLLLISSNLGAATVWGQIKNNYIESVAVFYDGYSNVVAITLVNPINTGCATDSSRSVHYWVVGKSIDLSVGSWVSTALSAQAQGKKVELALSNGACDQYYGRLWQGIKVFNN